MLQTLRRAGGSLIMTVPRAFTEQNRLEDGSKVELYLEGDILTVQATRRPRYKLADLMAEMPEGLPRAEGWDALPDAGQEAS